MSLLVVGSIALDSVETPHGVVHDALGGSATYFSYAASYLPRFDSSASSAKTFRPPIAPCLKRAEWTPPA